MHRKQKHEMKKLASIVLVGLAAMLAACTSAEQRQQYAEAAERVQRSVAQLKGALAKATGAKVRVMMAGEAKEQEFPVPAEEWGRLREILSHTAAVPPALENADEQEKASPYFIELVLLGNQGVELSGVPLTSEQWMPESEARKLAPARARSSLVADWCLPDADCEALKSISAISQAKSWAEQQ